LVDTANLLPGGIINSPLDIFSEPGISISFTVKSYPFGVRLFPLNGSISNSPTSRADIIASSDK